MADGDSLRVLVGDERGRSGKPRGLAAWLRRVAPAGARGTVSVAIVSDRAVRALNRRYRRADRATDVLSFPTAVPASSLRSPRWPRETMWRSSPGTMRPCFLGDIVIARGIARRQARAARHSELTELKILALHGLLHLLGYDHERDGGRMRRVEHLLRRRGGLHEGLIERGSGFTARQA